MIIRPTPKAAVHTSARIPVGSIGRPARRGDTQPAGARRPARTGGRPTALRAGVAPTAGPVAPGDPGATTGGTICVAGSRPERRCPARSGGRPGRGPGRPAGPTRASRVPAPGGASPGRRQGRRRRAGRRPAAPALRARSASGSSRSSGRSSSPRAISGSPAGWTWPQPGHWSPDAISRLPPRPPPGSPSRGRRGRRRPVRRRGRRRRLRCPAARSPTSPAARRAAAPLRTTMSRCGPVWPSRTARASRALATGSPPTRSSGTASGMPSSVGSRLEKWISPSATSHTAEVVVVVSSSSPSWPKNTSARSVPSSTRVATMRSAMAASPTPIVWRRAPAGLASGPRKLNVVGTPSSRRTGPAWRRALW